LYVSQPLSTTVLIDARSCTQVVAVKRAEDTTRLRRELAQAEQDASELQEMVLEKDARHEADKVRFFSHHQ